MLIPRLFVGALSVTLMIFGSGTASCQDYPKKPIRIFTAAPGGGADFTSRQIAQGISGPLGQPVIVENRTPVQSAEAVSKASPDGYSLFVSGSSIWILPLLQKAPYDMGDFSAISQADRTVSVVAIHPSMPAKTVKELIALAKAKPGQLNFGVTGLGGASQIAAQLFKSMADINIVIVPYKGATETLTSLINGEVQMIIYDAGAVSPHVKSGRMRALAVTSAQPSVLAPGLPTVSASGVPGYEWVQMTVALAPAKTPAVIISRLNQEIVRFLHRPDTKERFFNAGVEAVGSSSEELAATISSDIAKISKVIKDAGIKAN